MALTQIQNNPAIDLLANYPSGIGTSLNAQYSACDPTNGNYFSATGRDLVTFIGVPASVAPAWNAITNYTAGQVVNFAGDSASITAVSIATNVATLTATNTFTIGEQVLLNGLTTATFLNGQTATVTASTGTTFSFAFSHANYPLTATITNIAITTNVLTVTCANGFSNGQQVTLSGLTTATFLNGVTVTILVASGTQFTANFTHADYASASDTGTVTAVNTDTGTASNTAGPFIAIAASLNQKPHTPTAWASYAGNDTVSITSAPDSCTGRTANIVNYPVPVFDVTKSNVEFLVLPSSTFTLASGQVQFQASSNLVFVYVRNL